MGSVQRSRQEEGWQRSDGGEKPTAPCAPSSTATLLSSPQSSLNHTFWASANLVLSLPAPLPVEMALTGCAVETGHGALGPRAGGMCSCVQVCLYKAPPVPTPASQSSPSPLALLPSPIPGPGPVWVGAAHEACPSRLTVNLQTNASEGRVSSPLAMAGMHTFRR